MKKSRVTLGRLTVIAASVQLIFGEAPLALANPNGPQIVNGAANFQRPDSRTLSITNTPGTIINWQGFSIGAGELTRFNQQSATSSVMNRVVGGDISQIYGQLLSNGRVFLINPSGIVVGPGAMIDTAGFVASTLNMLDGDFLAGKLKFQGDASSGAIINQGWIRTGYGGHVLLVAPQIENSGLIQTPGGEILLAAGKSLTVTSLDLNGVQFEVQAPTDSVLNVGKLLADGGAVGVFAGSLRHSGEIRANALVYDQAGRIVLQAQSDVQIAAGSTVSADGNVGGDITVQSGGLTRVAGNLSAQGRTAQGGAIHLLGDRVAVVENATLNASGASAGGQILVGGDFQGANTDIQNANTTVVGSGASLRADATQSGDGGRIIVWSDDKTQFYGSLSARGGGNGGNGGFAEVSGKHDLIFAGNADLGAPQGTLGNLLLDPLDLYVFSGGGVLPSITDESTDFPSNAATVSPDTLAAITGNVSLFASRYMRISDPIDLSNMPGKGLTATVGTYTVPLSPDPLSMSSGIFNRLDIGADITTAGGAVSLFAPNIATFAASKISTNGGAITLDTAGGSSISASLLSLDAGSGAISANSGSFIQLGSIIGGDFTAMAPNFISTGAISTSGGAVNLTSTGSSIAIGNVTAGGGNVSLTGSGSVGTGIVDTTGSVVLKSTGSSIFSTVNNASSLSASGNSFVIINSSTDLNIDTATSNFSTASLATSNGAIRPVGSGQVSGFDVSLSSTDTGSGGGIGVVGGAALNVNVQRQLNFTTNAGFNVLLNGTGPNRFLANLNPANATTGNWTGSSITGSGFSLLASADTSTVTLSDLTVSNAAFNQFSSFISVATSGNLVANTVSVPTGNTTFAGQLPVFLNASGALTLNSYTRAGGGLVNFTSISSGGALTLGSIDAGNDQVSVFGSSGITLTSLMAGSNVTITSGGGITVSSLIGNGNVTLSASGSVNALDDTTPGVEIQANGALSITGASIGTGVGSNPLDLAAASITLTTNGGGGAAGAIGLNNSVVATTQNLTINAAGGSTFNVDTGGASLTDLTITANPISVGAGLAQVTTTGSYLFDATTTPGSFVFNPATTSGRNVSFTATTGNIILGATDLGTGNLQLSAQNGSILGGVSIDAADVLLNATNTITTGAITAGGDIGIHARGTVTTGALDAGGSVTVDGSFGCCASPVITVGAVTAGSGITLAAGGLLTVGGAITGGSGSTIILNSPGATPFQFSSINAGTTGSVFISSPNGIEQQIGVGNGITAQNISLSAATGDIRGLDSVPGGDHLDLLNGTNALNLTVDTGGASLFDLNANTLSSLTMTVRSGASTPVFAGFVPGQLVDFSVNGNFDLEVNSGSALNFSLDNRTGNTVALVGSGIDTGGGNLSLTSNAGIDTSAGVATSGGSVLLSASGPIVTGIIDSGAGSMTLNTFSAAGNIDVSGNLSGGTIALNAFSGGDISRSGGSTITGSSVSVMTTNGEIGTTGTPLLISSPSVTLNANRGGSASGNEGLVTADLTGTTTLNLTGAWGFDVNSDTAFGNLFVSTRGTGTGAVNLAASGQNFTFARTASDLFSTAGSYFKVVDVSGTALSNATFSVSDGTLLVAGPTTINATSLTLSSTNGADVSLQGTSGSPLALAHANQTFSATGGATADILVKGKVSLNASGSQTFTANGNIIADADAGGGGSVSISAVNQVFTTTGTASQMQFLGGAAAGEKVAVSATGAQRFNASTAFNSADMLRVQGGSGDGASVAISYSGTGNQELQLQNGIITIAGGTGLNSFAKIEHTGPGQQQLCHDLPFSGCSGNAGTLNILGGLGDGAFSQMTAAGSQFLLVSSATNVLAGEGNGANALIQAGTSQNLQMGNMTLHGSDGIGATATAQILASTGQSISASTISLLGGTSLNSFAKIGSSGSQTLFYSSLNMSAANGGSGSFVEIQAGGTQNLTGFGAFSMTAGTAPNTSAVIEGNSQSINGGAMTLTGGTGTNGSTSDVLIRNLSGNQTIQNTSSITLNGGTDFSLTGILNLGAGTQTITSSGALTLISNAASTVSAPVQLTNSAATRQKIDVQRINIQTNGAGDATLSSAGDQHIHTNNTTTNPSVRVAALGSGTASIQAATSQLFEVDYPQLMQGTRSGLISVGDANAIGNSLIQATDQSVFAGSVLVEAGSGTGSISKLSATNTQTISTLLGGVDVVGGTGDNSLATIDPISQTIVSNDSFDVSGGSGGNADGSIVSGGTQILINTSGDIVLTGGSGAGADAIISSLGGQSLTSGGDIILTGGTGANSDALISTVTTQSIIAGGDIFLTGGPILGSDAIISNIGAQQSCSLLQFSCGAQQNIFAGGSIILSPGSGLAVIEGGFASNSTGAASFLTADATQQTLANWDELTGAFDTLAPETEDPNFGRRAPICR